MSTPNNDSGVGTEMRTSPKPNNNNTEHPIDKAKELSLCSAFFSLHPVSKWTFQSFNVHCASFGVTGQVVNNRWTKGLEFIIDDKCQSHDRRRKAQSLLEKYRNTKKVHNRRRVRTSMSVKFNEGSNVTAPAFVQGHHNTTTTGKRHLTPEDDLPRKRPTTESNSNTSTTEAPEVPEVPEPTEEDEDVDTAEPFQQRSSPAIEDLPQYDALSHQPGLITYTFTSSKRAIVFEKHNPEADQPGVIDLDSEYFRDSLTPAEKSELLGSHPLPEFSDAFRFALGRFGSPIPTTFDELWDIAESSPRPPGVRYNCATNAEASYVNVAVACILVMIQNNKTSLWRGPESHQEGWYATNVWGPLIDHCFLTLDNCSLARTEIKSRVDVTENKRFDGIVCAFAGQDIAEFGAIEVAKDPNMIPADKADLDMEKLVVVMECMLEKLLKKVDGNMEYGKKLRVVGIQHIGFSMRVLRMHALSPTVFNVDRSAKSQSELPISVLSLR